MRLTSPILLILCQVLGHAAIAQSGLTNGKFPVWTRSYDNTRNAVNLQETRLKPSNVNVRSFGRLFARSVDGQIYAQPLYVPDLDMPGRGTRNVVYIATMHNSVYAFDADDPAMGEPLWHISFTDPVRQISAVPSTDVGQGLWGISRHRK